MKLLKNLRRAGKGAFSPGTVVRVAALCASLFTPPGAPALMPSDEALVERTGEHVRIVADCPRPLHAVALALASHFQLSVSVEDPLWTCAADLQDASVINAGMRPGTLIPRGGHLEVEFKLANAARDAAGVMMAVLEAANQQLSYQYRLDKDGDSFRLVPVRGRNAEGEMTDVVPVLDRLVTIPPGKRPVREVASRMAEELSKQTGLLVTCCETVIAGVPWGLEPITFEAGPQRARDVLKALLEPRRSPKRWLSRCDRQVCFIGFR